MIAEEIYPGLNQPGSVHGINWLRSKDRAFPPLSDTKVVQRPIPLKYFFWRFSNPRGINLKNTLNMVFYYLLKINYLYVLFYFLSYIYNATF